MTHANKTASWFRSKTIKVQEWQIYTVCDTTDIWWFECVFSIHPSRHCWSTRVPPPTGYAVWRTKIIKVCKRLFITCGFAKPFLSGHIPQKFSDNYSILTTTKPACSVELATNNQPRQHSNFGCFNFCNLSGGLTRHQSCGIAAQPHNGINETAKQIVALYVSSICWIHLEGGWLYMVLQPFVVAMRA